MTIFEEFLEYCGEDNPKLRQDIETWLCDFFDLPNRAVLVLRAEKKWIKENLSKETQKNILGRVVS